MSYPIDCPSKGCGLVATSLMVALLGGAAQAQDSSTGPRARVVRVESDARHLRRADRPADVRSLTINRRPDTTPDTDVDDGENSATVDGPIRYNSISTFDPVPYVDSGIQYPYGLDGIGGYGSDVGVRAGQDTALYQRGP